MGFGYLRGVLRREQGQARLSGRWRKNVDCSTGAAHATATVFLCAVKLFRRVSYAEPSCKLRPVCLAPQHAVEHLPQLPTQDAAVCIHLRGQQAFACVCMWTA